MAQQSHWYPRSRNYTREEKEYSLERHSVRTHPLAVSQKASTASATSATSATSTGLLNNGRSSTNSVSTKSSGFIDPLSQMSEVDGGGTFVAEARGAKSATVGNLTKEQLMGAWGIKKESILSRFTTTEKLTLTSSYLSGDDRVVTVTKSNLVSDRIQSRLEQLDSFEAGSMKEMLNLSQQEYVNKIDQLHAKLQTAWREDQRVTALKIAIQLAKLLSDVTPMQFYPSKFVLVTEVLEAFGQLIFERISEKMGKEKSENCFLENGKNSEKNVLEKDENSAEAAKETCRNWFFKVASIRELLPRLYIEISILRCLTFLEARSVFLEVVPRFAMMIRGIGDHLVASYARCYLARMIVQLAPELMPKSIVLVEDFVASMQQINLTRLNKRLIEQKLEMSSYILLHQPALEWITDCLAKNTKKNQNEKNQNENFLEKNEKNENEKNKVDFRMEKLLEMAEGSDYTGLLLNCVMTSFKADLVATSPMKIIGLIKKNSDDVFPTYILCRTLGICLLNADTDPKERKKILNEIWPIIASQHHAHNYISACEIWVEFVSKFFTFKEINRILGDILQHLLADRAFENCTVILVAILEKILRNLRNLTFLFGMENFLPFFNLIQKEGARLQAAKFLLDVFLKFPQDSALDPVVLNGVLFASKILHDSITSLSSEDEKRAASALICGFLRRVEFGSDFEAQLNFYADCRGVFSNLDEVAEDLTRSVNHLAMSVQTTLNTLNTHGTHSSRSSRSTLKGQGRHTKKTAAFVRACVAFSFITIPSFSDIPTQLFLYLETTQVALANSCLGQADALIKAAIQLFNGSKEELEMLATKVRPGGKGELATKVRSGKVAVEFASDLLSLMLVVPDPPEQGVLYLIRGIMNTIQSCDDSIKRPLQIQLLAYASAARQEEYLYHVEGVDSNDRLYGQNADFLQEIDKTASFCLSDLLATFDHLKNSKQIPLAVKLAHEILDVFLAHADLTRSLDTLDVLISFLKIHDAKKLVSVRKFAEARQRTDGSAWTGLVNLL